MQTMTRRDRLMATLRGEAVDRPPVCFYEINGHTQEPDDPDPFNIYNDPSWLPLIELARDKTDRVVLRGVPIEGGPDDPMSELVTEETTVEDGARVTRRTVRAGKRTLTARWRRNPEVNTIWHDEHLLKDADDLKAYLELPVGEFGGEPSTEQVLTVEEQLGDTGIVTIDMGDPIGGAAPLFSMADYTIVAMTEQDLFHRLLQRSAEQLWPRCEAVARALPGRLWRVVGSEYASPPYLPPDLYKEYFVRYTKPMVESIQKYGGYARIHSHGRLRDILDDIASTGCTGLDPIEPPPQGDVSLAYVRERYGKQMVLFGNIEASDIENLPTPEFAKKVDTALHEGTAGEGRGFVLMPSACPYGRKLSELALTNYQCMIEKTENFSG